MKNLKTFLFLGLISIFANSAFAQNPHPTKFPHETELSTGRSVDNGNGSMHSEEFEDYYYDDSCPTENENGSRDYLLYRDMYRKVINFGIY